MVRTRQPGRGPSQRQLRVGELIRRTLADVLVRGDLAEPEVRTSPDLRHATAYVLPLGGENAGGVAKALNRHRAELRRLVTREMTLKHSPELSFVVDETFDQMERTRELLAREAVRRDVEKE
jgi:ribosome-binding factor A